MAQATLGVVVLTSKDLGWRFYGHHQERAAAFLVSGAIIMGLSMARFISDAKIDAETSTTICLSVIRRVLIDE